MPKYRVKMHWAVDAVVDGESRDDVARRLSLGIGDVLQSMGAGESTEDNPSTILMQGEIIEEGVEAGRIPGTPSRFSN